MELGCDANGFSRAGNNTVTWYCVILAGRPSIELNRMREVIPLYSLFHCRLSICRQTFSISMSCIFFFFLDLPCASDVVIDYAKGPTNTSR